MKEKQLFEEQRPWLDINGDGLYSKKEAEKGSDIDVEKETIQLGKEGIHAAPPPTIHQVHPLL